MNIVVCVNHVPDSAAKIAVGGDGKQIEKTGVQFVLNPYDEYALEMGLRLKEKQTGTVTAVTLGGDAAKETLRKAYAMGIDKAVLLKDEAARDSLSTAQALAAYIKTVNPDVVLLGKQSIDYDGCAVGSMVGEFLGLPSISVVVSFDIEGNTVVAEREIEGGKEKVTATIPVVITAQKGVVEPRYPNLKGIMAAKSKPIEEIIPAAAENKTEVVALRKPASKQAGRIVGAGKEAVPELVRLLHEEAKVI